MKVIGDGVYFQYKLNDDGKTYTELHSYNYDDTYARKTFVNETTKKTENYPLITK